MNFKNKKKLIFLLGMIFSINAFSATNYFFNLKVSNVKYKIDYIEKEEPSENWLDFFQFYGQLTNINSLKELESRNDNIYVNNKSLIDNKLPQETLGIKIFPYLNLDNNSITNIAFFKGVNKINSTLSAKNNQLKNIDGLIDLTFISQLFLSNNNLTNVNGLANLTNARSIHLENNSLTNISGLANLASNIYQLKLNNNPNLTDLSPLANIPSTVTSNPTFGIFIDNPEQYTTKIPSGSPLCNAILSNNAQVYFGTTKLNYSSVCEQNDEWVKLFHENNQATNISTAKSLETENIIIYLQSKNFNDEDLPTIELNANSLYLLYLFSNNLTHVDFLSNLKTVRHTLNLSNNQLSNLDGLSNLKSSYQIYLNDNNLTNVNGLANLTNATNVYLENNSLTNISGLANLASNIYQLKLNNNPNLTDLSPLANIPSTVTSNSSYGIFIDNPEQYTTKIPSGSPLCNAILSNNAQVYFGTTKLNYSSVCEQNDEWVKLFHENNQATNISTAKSLETENIVIYLLSKNFNDEDLPTIALNANSLYLLYLFSNNLTHVDFLSNLKTVRHMLNLSNNQLSNLDGLLNLTTVNGQMNLSNNNLTNINGLSSLTTVNGQIYLNDNNLANVNGLTNLVNARSIYLENNSLTNISGLANLSSLIYQLNLNNNPNLTDLSPLANIPSTVTSNSSYGIFIDNPEQYTTKIPSGSPLCNAILSNNAQVYFGTTKLNYSSVCEQNDEWVKLFHENNQATNISTAKSLETENIVIYLQSKNFNDEDLPTIELNANSLYLLYLFSNNLTHVDFLSNLKTVRHTLNLSNNQLSNLDGLSNLKSSYQIYLNDNNLTNVNGLANLTNATNVYLENNSLTNISGLANLASNIYQLKLNNNPNLTDLSPLANIPSTVTSNSSYGIFIDNPEQYTTKIPSGSPLCNAILSNNAQVYFGTTKLNYSSVCEQNDEWVKLFHENNQATNISTAKSLETENIVIYLLSKNFNDEDLPTIALNANSLYLLYLFSNNLTHVDFLSNLKTVRHMLNLSNNQLSNLDGLLNLTTVNGQMNLSNNNLTNINGLSSLTTVNGQIYLNDNNLANVNGLTNLVNARSIYLENNSLTNISGLANLSSLIYQLNLNNNPNLTDLSPLANIPSTVTSNSSYGIFIDNPEQYTTKIPSGSPLCNAILSNNAQVYFGTTKLNYSSVCEQNDEWVKLFHENNQATNISTAKSLETENIVIYLQSKNFNDEDLPTIELNANSLYLLYLFSNNLTHVDFLSNLKTVRHTLNLSNNQLSNLDGLSNLKSSYQIYLNDNNLTNVNGLANLTNATNVYLENNSLTNISGLANLASNIYQLKLNNNPNLTDLSPLANIPSTVTSNSSYGIFIDNPEQYTTKIPSGSPLCNAILSNNAQVYFGTTKITHSIICK